jgi:DNA-directed RNA polymerase subunit RPC12/RpoP
MPLRRFPPGRSRIAALKPSAMALVEIRCPRCSRHGYVAADRLPRVLRCSRCGAAELISGDAVTDAKPKLTQRTLMPA